MKIPLPLIIEEQKREEHRKNETNRPFLELPIPNAQPDHRRSEATQPVAPKPSRGVTIISIWGDDDEAAQEDDGVTTLSIF